MSVVRNRSERGVRRERAWWRRHRELLQRDRLPAPDPVRQPREYGQWMLEHAQCGLPSEWKRHLAALRNLPSVKYRRDRDERVFSWIACLLARDPRVEPWLRNVRLGANPREDARPSAMLLNLTAIVAKDYPDVTALALFDAIRYWRKRRTHVECVSVSTVQGETCE